MISILFIYLLLGIFAGLISGLFGIGGGLVIVPALIFSFEILKIPQDLHMYMAIATSLATILVTVSSAVVSHSKIAPIDKKTVIKLFIPTVCGTILGSMFSSTLSVHTLKIIFAVYVSLVSIKMLLDLKVQRNKKDTSIFLFIPVGLIIGFKSAILGIGGGTISIPFLSWRGYSMKRSVGISASLGIPIAFFGAASYAYNGFKVLNLPAYSFGYIYLPAFLGVVITSPFFARIGAKLSHSLPQKRLKKSFAILLMVVAIKTIITL